MKDPNTGINLSKFCIYYCIGDTVLVDYTLTLDEKLGLLFINVDTESVTPYFPVRIHQNFVMILLSVTDFIVGSTQQVEFLVLCAAKRHWIQ